MNVGLKGMRARARAWMMEYAYLVMMGAMAAIVAASAVYTQRLHGSGVPAAAQAQEIAPPAASAETPQITPAIAPLTVRREAVRTSGAAAWPAGGGIVRGYDAQQAVYWEALACYKPHAGLDIAGEAGEDVCAAADGVVSGLRRDELWGWQVAVKQMDGREMTYAGLETAVVGVGDSVSRGKPLGRMAPYIPCEAELPAHVHLELRQDGMLQDPEAMMPER